ncbi:MAG TPA: hypothetical protein DEB06_09555 [Phycisphaerales bacterium]|nr:hypothetical protein [Phycisphaerales bacterium]
MSDHKPGSDGNSGAPDTPPRRRLRVDSLEERILMSASWADADAATQNDAGAGPEASDPAPTDTDPLSDPAPAPPPPADPLRDDATISTGRLTLTADMEVDDLTVTRIERLDGANILVTGDITTTDTSMSGTGAFVLDGAGDQTIGANGGSGELHRLVIEKDSGSVTIEDRLEISAAYDDGGFAVDATNATVEFQGSPTITAGATAFGDVVLDASRVTLTEDLYIQGDLTVERLTQLNGGTIHVAGEVTVLDGNYSGTTRILAWEPEPLGPMVALSPSDASGVAGQPVELDLGLSVDGTRAPDAVITLSGVPEGATLSAGQPLGNGVWALVPADAQGLTITPPEGFSGELELRVNAHTGAALSFTQDGILSHGGAGQDLSGSASVLPGGAGVELSGNNWKAVDFQYTVTRNTVLEFEFRTDRIGEIHGIGFDTDDSLTEGRFFKVAGTQQYATSAGPGQDLGDGWTRYTVDVGAHFRGDMSRLVLANDMDAGTMDAHSAFRNVSVRESYEKAPESVSSVVRVSFEAAPAPAPVPAPAPEPESVDPIPQPEAEAPAPTMDPEVPADPNMQASAEPVVIAPGSDPAAPDPAPVTDPAPTGPDASAPADPSPPTVAASDRQAAPTDLAPPVDAGSSVPPIDPAPTPDATTPTDAQPTDGPVPPVSVHNAPPVADASGPSAPLAHAETAATPSASDAVPAPQHRPELATSPAGLDSPEAESPVVADSNHTADAIAPADAGPPAAPPANPYGGVEWTGQEELALIDARAEIDGLVEHVQGALIQDTDSEPGADASDDAEDRGGDLASVLARSVLERAELTPHEPVPPSVEVDWSRPVDERRERSPSGARVDRVEPEQAAAAERRATPGERGASQHEAEAAVAQSGSMLARVWSLVRGLGGLRSDDEQHKESRR